MSLFLRNCKEALQHVIAAKAEEFWLLRVHPFSACLSSGGLREQSVICPLQKSSCGLCSASAM